MRVLPFILALALVTPPRLQAQTVVADIRIGGGPVYGRVLIGHPPVYHSAPVVVAPYHEHYHCRAVVVRHGPPGQIRRYHRAVVWYHPATGRYYEHRHPGLYGLRQVRVREMEGRYWFDG